MHIIRWLFLHPVIFAWVLAILAILLNYGISGDKGDAHHAKGAVEATEPHADTDAAHKEGNEPHVTKGTAEQHAKVAMVEKKVQAEATPVVEAVAMGDDKSAVTVAVEQVKEKAGDATEQAVDKAGDAAGAVKTAAVTAVATVATVVVGGGETVTKSAVVAVRQSTGQTGAEQAAVAGESTDTATPETDAVTAQTAEVASTTDLLIAAREAYWSNDFDRAAGFYQELLARDNQPSYKGELANVYWKQGNSQEAVKLYTDIAVWLKDQGRVAELQDIKVYIDQVDPAAGQKIGELLQ
ncbi:MAG: hypothetical protein CSA79_02665 [Thiothrix nivea]|nr:MAG: hypothetical protein CSA79_02665 [Thiothrix nivea]